MNRQNIPRVACCPAGSHFLVLAILLVAGMAYGGPFSSAINYSVGNNPVSLCTGNLRGNNYIRDLAVANFSDNSVSVRLCLDDGTFGHLDTYAVGLQPTCVRYGDFNRDGQDDLVTANSGTNTVSVLMNLGVGANFRAVTNFTVGTGANSGPRDIRVADINGDGRGDLVVAVYNENCVSVLTNKGNGTFGGLVNYPISGGAGPVSVAVADLNLDGLPDIVVLSTNGTYSILFGLGGGLFDNAVTTELFAGGDPRPVSMVATDINKDGVVDLVIANANSNSVTVILGSYSGQWEVGSRFDYIIPTAAVSPAAIFVRDMNHDGIIDIAVACASDTNVWVYLGSGSGAFEEPPLAVPTGSGNSAAIAGSNFNGDGATDLVVANYAGSSVSVLLYGGPLAYDVATTVSEDVPTPVVLRGALLGGGAFLFRINSVPAHGTLTGSPTNLVYTSETNYFGPDSFTFSTIDPGTLSTSAVATVTLTVLPVNDAPRFTLSVATVTVLEDSPLTNFPGIIADAFTGTNEAGQTYIFSTSSSSNAFFSSRPAISSTGTLTFRPALNKVGTVPVYVQMRDNGGTLRGGVNVSATQTFNIVVTPSPIKPLRGVYNGLFYEATGVRSSAAGFFTFTMAANGSFTGRLTSEYGRDAFAGRFNLAGHATVLINRANNSNVELNLQLDLSGGSDQVTGTISDGNWTADISGDRLLFSPVANPAPQAGRYTLAVPGYLDAAVAPGGSGYGVLTVTTAGKVSFSGKLGDGTGFSQATSLSKNGQWPFYAVLYRGQGLVLGWVNFTNRPTSSLEGGVSWINTTLGGNYYPVGFAVSNSVIGSTYTPPGFGERVLVLTNCSMVLKGGNLTGTLTNNVLFTETNTVFSVDISTLDSRLKLSTAASGIVTGSFLPPGLHSRKTFSGVVLQQQNTAHGYFLGATETGSFLLRAD